MKKTKLLAVLLSLVLMGILAIGVTVAGTVNRIGTSKVGSIVNSYTGGNSQVYINTVTKLDGTVVYYIYSSNIRNTQTVFDNLRNAVRNPYSGLIPAVADENGTVGLAVCSDPSLVDSMDENWISSEWVGRNVVAVESVKNVTNETGDGIDLGAIAAMHEGGRRNLAAEQAAEAENYAKWQAIEAEKKAAWDAAEEAKAEEDADYVPQEYVGFEYVPLDFGDTAVENQKALESNQFESIVGTNITPSYEFKDGKLVEVSNIENIMHVTTIYATHTIIDDTEGNTSDEGGDGTEGNNGGDTTGSEGGDITTDEEEPEVISAPVSHGGWSGGGRGKVVSSSNTEKTSSKSDDKNTAKEADVKKSETNKNGLDTYAVSGKQLEKLEVLNNVLFDKTDAIALVLKNEQVANSVQNGNNNGNDDSSELLESLTRWEMAKISVIIAKEFMGHTENLKKTEDCSRYGDLVGLNDEQRSYVVKSCELGYMGYQANGIDYLKDFRPYDPVTVAEASIIVSRILWGNKYVISDDEWYKGHLWAVYENGLIDDISKPFLNITRWEAFEMLYRVNNFSELKY